MHTLPHFSASAASEPWESERATFVDPPDVPSDAPDEAEGRLLGGAYRLLTSIGTGSTGAVYAAEGSLLERRGVQLGADAD